PAAAGRGWTGSAAAAAAFRPAPVVSARGHRAREAVRRRCDALNSHEADRPRGRPGMKQLGVVAVALACATLAACAAQDGAAHAAQADASRQVSADAPADRGVPPPLLDTSRLVATEIVDQAGFGRPVAAWRLQVPAGWQTTGGVIWNDGANC